MSSFLFTKSICLLLLTPGGLARRDRQREIDHDLSLRINVLRRALTDRAKRPAEYISYHLTITKRKGGYVARVKPDTATVFAGIQSENGANVFRDLVAFLKRVEPTLLSHRFKFESVTISSYRDPPTLKIGAMTLKFFDAKRTLRAVTLEDPRLRNFRCTLQWSENKLPYVQALVNSLYSLERRPETSGVIDITSTWRAGAAQVQISSNNGVLSRCNVFSLSSSPKRSHKSTFHGNLYTVAGKAIEKTFSDVQPSDQLGTLRVKVFRKNKDWEVFVCSNGDSASYIHVTVTEQGTTYMHLG